MEEVYEVELSLAWVQIVGFEKFRSDNAFLFIDNLVVYLVLIQFWLQSNKRISEVWKRFIPHILCYERILANQLGCSGGVYSVLDLLFSLVMLQIVPCLRRIVFEETLIDFLNFLSAVTSS